MRMSNRLLATGLLALAAPALFAHDHGAAAHKEGAAAAISAHGTAADCWKPAFVAGDADAVAACYAEDAVMYFPGGSAAAGRAAIRDGYAHYFSEYTITDAQLVEVGRVAHGDTVTSWGDFTITMVPKAGGAPIVSHGRFTDVSKRIDGQWRYVVDHASDHAPAPATVPAG